MRQTNQDTPAGRIQTSQFDTVLPPDVRSELVRPKRPTSLRQPRELSHSEIWKWIGAFALTLVILAGVIAHYSKQLPPATPQPDPVLEHSRQILKEPVQPTQPISQPPIQQPTSEPPRLVWEWVRSETYGPVWVQCYETCTPARGGLIVCDPVPHAQLMRSPVPRAELVRLPQ